MKCPKADDGSGRKAGKPMTARNKDVDRGSDEFVRVPGELPARLDRQLGYFGDARYCLFYFDDQTEGVVWKDGRSYGFGAGAWRPFDEHIAPLAHEHGASADHALIIDREGPAAYFAPRETAERIVTEQHRPAPCLGAA